MDAESEEEDKSTEDDDGCNEHGEDALRDSKCDSASDEEGHGDKRVNFFCSQNGNIPFLMILIQRIGNRHSCFIVEVTEQEGMLFAVMV